MTGGPGARDVAEGEFEGAYGSGFGRKIRCLPPTDRYILSFGIVALAQCAFALDNVLRYPRM